MSKGFVLRIVNPADEAVFEKQLTVSPKDILIFQIPDDYTEEAIDCLIDEVERVFSAERLAALVLPESIKLRIMTVTDEETSK